MAARHKVTNILLKITAKIDAGEKICVVGNSRSGKSLFLLSILDETEMTGGEIRMNGRVSFLNNNMPLLEDSIRENIKFGTSMNRDLYERV